MCDDISEPRGVAEEDIICLRGSISDGMVEVEDSEML